MENYQPNQGQESIAKNDEGVFNKYHVVVKSFIIFILLLIFIIPQVFTSELIRERENNQEAAFIDISEKWSGRQTITGPIMAIPYL